MDLIDKDTLKKDVLDLPNCYNGFSDTYDKACIIGLIDEQPIIEERKWIPCSERLPEEETDVLVTRTFLGCKDGSRGWNNHIPPKTYVEVAQYFNGEWTALSDEYKVARSRHTKPVAWMPLPEPWRGEE